MVFGFIKRLFGKTASPAPAPSTGFGESGAVFRGYFERIEIAEGRLIVDGWMISERGAYEGYTLHVNGVRRANGKRVARPDVVQALPGIPNAEHCGFHFETPVQISQPDECLHLSVRGSIMQTEPGRMNTGYWPDMESRLPIPPSHLIKRVDGTGQGQFYLLKGAQNFWEIKRIVETRTPLHAIDAMLDWGCGSGRLIGFFQAYSPIKQLYGCDIDAEAVAWCHSNFEGAKFARIPLMPPTKYPGDRFGLIVAFSVLTHLAKDALDAWLQEMERILKPEGLLVATVHGKTAAQAMLGVEQAEEAMAGGFHDSLRDDALKGVAPDGYYRTVFISETYVRSAWSERFVIVDYIEQGASNFHDIVVMKKRNRTGAVPRAEQEEKQEIDIDAAHEALLAGELKRLKSEKGTVPATETKYEAIAENKPAVPAAARLPGEALQPVDPMPVLTIRRNVPCWRRGVYRLSDQGMKFDIPSPTCRLREKADYRPRKRMRFIPQSAI